jgi:predicted HAD superfamily hydrolase
MPDAIGSTRYEEIMQAADAWPRDLGERFAGASRAARAAVTVAPGDEAAIRDVAVGVAAPALVAFVLWLLEEAERRGLRRLRFLSRDGQVLYELACRLAATTGSGLDLEYVYSSRITWSLAATDPASLAQTAWLYNSFIHSNAADVCSRLGLPAADFRRVMLD